MKYYSIFLSLFLSANAFTQKATFVRVFDLEGRKIASGRVIQINDSSLQVNAKMLAEYIPVRQIGIIKTKRSGGNNVLVGSLIGFSTMAIYGAATADPDATFFAYSAGTGAILGGIIGIPLGAAVGGVTTIFKNPKTYIIQGDPAKWALFQQSAAVNDEK